MNTNAMRAEMMMRIRLLTWTQLILSLAIFLGSLPAYGQNNGVQLRKRPKTVNFRAVAITEADHVRELYVGVIGEVERPGTYHVDPSELNIQSVISKRAGGLTPLASKTIRVVRYGKVNHQEVYSESDSSPLHPGDLLIVEGNRTNSSSTWVEDFESDKPTVNASYEEPVLSNGIQVALLNVLDYPIILPVHPEQATAVNIAENILGQSPDILAYTTVISADPATRTLSEKAKQAIQLVGGSVVVFDRGLVNRGRLPGNLPKPIESAIAYGAQTGLIGNPLGQSAELQNLGNQVLNTRSFSVQGNGSSSATPITPGTIEQGPGSLHPPSSFKTPIATIPFSGGSAKITRSSTESLRADDLADSIPHPDEAQAQLDDLEIDSPASLEVQAERRAKGFSFVPMIAVLFVAAGLVGGSLIVRRALESKIEQRDSVPQFAIEPAAPVLAPVTVAISEPVAVPEIPVPETAAPLVKKTLLELLVKNELPLAFEAVEFPSGLTLQGRITPKPILRVDGPQDVIQSHGPHIDASETESDGYSLQPVVTELDRAEKSSIRRPHFLDADRQPIAAVDESGPIQREKTTKSSDRSNAPLASALFELEQGDRS